jgi:hypothetical protein
MFLGLDDIVKTSLLSLLKRSFPSLVAGTVFFMEPNTRPAGLVF